MTAARKPARRAAKSEPPVRAVADTSDVEAVDLDLDVVKDEAAHTPFTFRIGGEKFTLQHFEDADVSWVLDADDGAGDLQMMRGAIHAAFADDADYKRFRAHRLSLTQLNELFDRWQQHAGLEPGESAASSPS